MKNLIKKLTRLIYLIFWYIKTKPKFYLRWKDYPVFAMDYPTIILTAKNTHYYNTKYHTWIGVSKRFNPECPVTLDEYKNKQVNFFYYIKNSGNDGLKKLINEAYDNDIYTINKGDLEGYAANQENPSARSGRIKQIVQRVEGDEVFIGLKEE